MIASLLFVKDAEEIRERRLSKEKEITDHLQLVETREELKEER